MGASKSGTIVPKKQGYHQGVTERRAAKRVNQPINHELINRACELFFLRRGMALKESVSLAGGD